MARPAAAGSRAAAGRPCPARRGTTTWGHAGSASATAVQVAQVQAARPGRRRRRPRSARTPRHQRQAERDGAGELPLDRAPAAPGGLEERPPAAEGVVVEVGGDGRSGSTRRRSTTRRAAVGHATPRTPTTPWAIMPSAGVRRGSVGMAGAPGSVNDERRGRRWVGDAAGSRLPSQRPPVTEPSSDVPLFCSSAPPAAPAAPNRWPPPLPPGPVRSFYSWLSDATESANLADRALTERSSWLLGPPGWCCPLLLVRPVADGSLDGRSSRGAVGRARRSVAGLGRRARGAPRAVDVGLTAVRLIAPPAPLAAVAAAHGAARGRRRWPWPGRSPPPSSAFTAEVGQAFVQRSAYGDERPVPPALPGRAPARPVPLAWAACRRPRSPARCCWPPASGCPAPR